MMQTDAQVATCFYVSIITALSIGVMICNGLYPYVTAAS